MRGKFDRTRRPLAIACLIAAGALAGCSSSGAGDAAGPTAGAGALGSAGSTGPVRTIAAGASPAATSPAPDVDSTDVATDPPAPAATTTATTTATATATATTAAGGGRPAPAEVVITYAGQDPGTSAVQVGGYVTDVIEDGGTCTLTLTSGSTTRTASAQAQADASTTDCGGLEVAAAELKSGTWKAVLSYASPRYQGAAPAVSVAVK